LKELITYEEAFDHLRLDSSDDESLVQAYIQSASSAILSYIGDNAFIEVEEKTVVRDEVKQACKLLVGNFYRNREASENTDKLDAGYGYGYLPPAVLSLIFHLRDLC